ncbi:MAG: 30S ribosomal protein S17e [Halobacteriales archaeon]|nr:30S ribosomal protein S17e [Halobacteriales archaeon]
MTIDPTDVIEIGDSLLERHGDAFGPDFEANKQQVGALTSVESRNLRNRVAGYITRLKAE